MASRSPALIAIEISEEDSSGVRADIVTPDIVTPFLLMGDLSRPKSEKHEFVGVDR